MKSITLVLILAACKCSFGQLDTNVIALGNWSPPVTNGFWQLRGRLLVYEAEDGNGVIRVNSWPHGRIYLELQNVKAYNGPPLEFYFYNGYDFDGDKSCLHFEMRDGQDRLIPLGIGAYWGPVPDPFVITLPSQSTIRVRVDFDCETTSTKPNGLQLFVSPTKSWTIRADSTNDYYLSATFSQPTNLPSGLNYPVWQETLQLPKVKIAAERIKKR